MNTSETYLLEDLAKGDELAFSNIYKEYSLALYSLIYRKLGNISKAEDLTKELFLALIHYAKEWQQEISLKLHLYSLTVKRCNRELAKNQISQNLDLVQSALAKLDSESIDIVLLSEYQNLKILEISKILKIDIDSVKEKLLIAKEILADSLLTDKFEAINHCVVRPDLQAFLSKEVEKSKSSEIESHIVNCTACQETINKLKMVSEALQTWTTPEPNLLNAHEIFTISQPTVGFLGKTLVKSNSKYTLAVFAILLAILFYIFPKDLISTAPTQKPSLPQLASTSPMPPPAPPSAPAPAANYEKPASMSVSKTLSLDSRSDSAIAGGVESGVIGGVVGGVIGGTGVAEAPPPPPSVNMAVKEVPKAIRSVQPLQLQLQQLQTFEPPKMPFSQLKETERLIVKTASLWIDTDNFDEAKNSIADLAKSKGGFLNKLYVTTESNGRTAQIIFRVPSRNFDTTIVELRKYGKITQELIEGQDVTDKYFDAVDDIEGNKELDKTVSEQNPSRNLSKVDIEEQHLQIRKQNLQLKRYLAQLREGADLSTISFNLREITKDSGIIVGTKELSTWGQIKQSFFNGFSNLFAILLPILLFAEEAGFSIIFFGAITVLIYLLVDRHIKKSSTKYPSDFNDWRG